MQKNLVIVESPAKAKTIEKFLGKDFVVKSSFGHIRDLPKKELSIDINNGFVPTYEIPTEKVKLVTELSKAAAAAEAVWLASDEDREGEAIAWHLTEVLGLSVENTKRIVFHEITKNAILNAIENPRTVDMNLVNAQQARRVLDRIVGFELSPILWKKVRPALSAGRVQSVAVRLIVEREREIINFKSSSSYRVVAQFYPIGDESKTLFKAEYSQRFATKEEAMAMLERCKTATFTVEDSEMKPSKRYPAPPFTTSTLQQEAGRKFSMSVSQTMSVAQKLYERGLITYMRTDSLRVSADAMAEAKSYIEEKYGASYCPSSPRVYKSRATAQDAHEAIRPSRVGVEPIKIRKYLTSDQYKLYKLIWERFVASQMQSASLSTLTVDCESASYIFRASGYTVDFQGYMAVYEETEDDTARNADEPSEQRNIRLPEMKEGDALKTLSVTPDKHFTEPPARYNDASLVKFLEEMGIGRPSTFATIISTIISRNYVKREGKMLVPTPTGEVTNKLMMESFPDIVSYKFTAEMENDLDGIEQGKVALNRVLEDFWGGFERELSEANEKMKDAELSVPVEETDIICDKCGSRMIVKNGRFGKFAACPNYPQCRSTKPLVSSEQSAEKDKKPQIIADFKCELCGADMVQRSGRYGSFFACSRFPECSFTKQKTRDIGVPCPKCGSKIVMKNGKNKTVFYSCEKYPACDFSSWDMPVNEKCPDCGEILFRKKGQSVCFCRTKGCGFKKEIKE